MKRIKELLDFLSSLAKAWPVILVVVGLVVATILALSRFGSTSVQVGSLPLMLILLLFALAAYPILKLLQWIVARLFSKSFEYKGLIWKSSIFGIRPYCPICLREVDCVRKEPPSAWIGNNLNEMQGFINRAGRYTYSYECAIHGVLVEAQNLVDEAKREMKWRRSNNTNQSEIQNR